MNSPVQSKPQIQDSFHKKLCIEKVKTQTNDRRTNSNQLSYLSHVYLVVFIKKKKKKNFFYFFIFKGMVNLKKQIESRFPENYFHGVVYFKTVSLLGYSREKERPYEPS